MCHTKSDYLLGLDIGGTDTKYAVVDDNRCIVQTGKIRCRSTSTIRGEFLNHLARCLDELSDFWPARGLGVAIAGEVLAGGILGRAPNLPSWQKTNCLTAAQSLTEERPVRVLNDVQAAAYAITAGMVGRLPQRSALLVAIGTGVGGALIEGGRVSGALTSGVEFGHLPVVASTRRCDCGRCNCIEAYVGSKALCQDLASALNRGVDARDLPVLLGRDAVSATLLRRNAKLLGHALASAHNLISVENIMIFGGVAAAYKPFDCTIRSAFVRSAFSFSAKRVKFYYLQNSAFVGAIGAAASVI